MNWIKKIEELNTYCKGCLCICHYNQWELNSYGHSDIFSYGDKVGLIKGVSLKELINYAYTLYKKEIEK